MTAPSPASLVTGTLSPELPGEDGEVTGTLSPFCPLSCVQLL